MEKKEFIEAVRNELQELKFYISEVRKPYGKSAVFKATPYDKVVYEMYAQEVADHYIKILEKKSDLPASVRYVIQGIGDRAILNLCAQKKSDNNGLKKVCFKERGKEKG